MLDELGPKNIVAGGKVDVQERFVEPTIVRGEVQCGEVRYVLMNNILLPNAGHQCLRARHLAFVCALLAFVGNYIHRVEAFHHHAYDASADAPMDSKIMSEEIFGPLLPVHKFRDISTVIAHIKENEKPLTLYMFARNRRNIDR
jgi:hypothetical protein